MKNLTGTTLQWKGQNYNAGDEVPDDVAKEMGLEKLPDQIAGQQAQEGAIKPITDPYDPLALAAAQAVSPPINAAARDTPTTEQSTPSVAYGEIVNFGAQTIPVNLKPLEEASTGESPEAQTEPGKSESEALSSLVEDDQTIKTLQSVKETEEEAATTQEEAIATLDEAITEVATGEEPPPPETKTTTRTSKK